MKDIVNNSTPRQKSDLISYVLLLNGTSITNRVFGWAYSSLKAVARSHCSFPFKINGASSFPSFVILHFPHSGIGCNTRFECERTLTATSGNQCAAYSRPLEVKDTKGWEKRRYFAVSDICVPPINYPRNCLCSLLVKASFISPMAIHDHDEEAFPDISHLCLRSAKKKRKKEPARAPNLSSKCAQYGLK